MDSPNDSHVQSFTYDDGVLNAREHVLGRSNAINPDFCSVADKEILGTLSYSSRKIDALNSRLTILDLKLDSKPRYAEKFTIGIASNTARLFARQGRSRSKEA
ncbi:hypothetical protein K1719_012188 [Acacia pycnantha]|nr:hypothetical protein K1719_012188 [Acacia pycnantha]